MRISIKEYYEYEKSAAGNMTDEQKETMSNMGAALKEAESTEFQGLGTRDISVNTHIDLTTKKQGDIMKSLNKLGLIIGAVLIMMDVNNDSFAEGESGSILSSDYGSTDDYWDTEQVKNVVIREMLQQFPVIKKWMKAKH